MANYRYLVGDLAPASGNGLREEIPFDTVKFSHILNRPGGFSATLPLRHTKATRDNLGPGRTAIHVERDGVIVWSGILWTAKASIDNATLELGGEGWWSYFRRRLVTTTQTFLAADAFLIARTLINNAQAVAGGSMGIAVGAETCGVLRDRTYFHYERKPVAEAVEQLAGVQNGFDFAIDVAYVGTTITKTLTLGYPRRGRITPIIFELGTNIEGLTQEVDATRQANKVDALGTGEGDTMLIATAADPSALTLYPLLEDVVTFKDVSVINTLTAHAASALTNRAQPVTRLPTLLAVQVNPDAGLGNYITGDSVQVKAQVGWLGLDERMRIQGYTVTVDTEGRERVAVEFAQEEASIA
jgi:hypothetical protein